MKKILIWSAVILGILGAIAIGVVRYYQSLVKFNTNYVNGNTPGNLYNGGLFCENNGTVFFANPDDNNRLYSMDPGGSNLNKLCDDTVMYINADSHYVYYVRNNVSTDFSLLTLFSFGNNSLCRIDRSGGKVTILDKDPCIYASLIGNSIYYLHYDTETATTLYKIDIDGKNKKKLSNNYIFTCSSSGQYFFYNGTQTDGSIYRYDTATDTSALVYQCNSYKPIVTEGGNAYYLDVDKDNALVHVNINQGTPTILSRDSIDLYNVYGSTIYYQRYSENAPALCTIKKDGSGFSEIAQGNYHSINVTSYYLYFSDFSTNTVYYTPTANPGTLTAFHPGKIED